MPSFTTELVVKALIWSCVYLPSIAILLTISQRVLNASRLLRLGPCGFGLDTITMIRCAFFESFPEFELLASTICFKLFNTITGNKVLLTRQVLGERLHAYRKSVFAMATVVAYLLFKILSNADTIFDVGVYLILRVCGVGMTVTKVLLLIVEVAQIIRQVLCLIVRAPGIIVRKTINIKRRLMASVDRFIQRWYMKCYGFITVAMIVYALHVYLPPFLAIWRAFDLIATARILAMVGFNHKVWSTIVCPRLRRKEAQRTDVATEATTV